MRTVCITHHAGSYRAKFTLTGFVVGSLVALALARIGSTTITTLHPADPELYLGTALFTVVIAIASVAIPAWRALRVNPLVALRHE